MKLRNLFLAGIAVVAMASCSNEVDGIDNGGNGNVEENALMQFRFTYGNASTGVRANGDKESGLDAEQGFTEALLVIDYIDEDAATPNKVEIIGRNQFNPVSGTSTDGKYFQSAPFKVAKGKMNAYVVLNPTSTIKSALQGLNGNTNDVVVALNAARIATIASATGNNAFVMYGSTTNQTLQEKQTTPVSVTVDRIVAKMKEETNSDKISNDVTMSATGQELTGTVDVTLKGYVFTNQTAESTLSYQGAIIAPTLNIFNGISEDGTLYTYDTRIGNPANDAQITYCFENENSEKASDETHGEGNTITSIIYKAKISATGINDNIDENVYVYNNTVYNYTGLKTAYEQEGGKLELTDEAKIDDFAALTITKYKSGICYYRRVITTNGDSNIIKRNNVYKLEVTKVSKLGYPTPLPIVDQTMMRLNLTMNPWTVNENAFEL